MDAIKEMIYEGAVSKFAVVVEKPASLMMLGR
jgi:hypothetical protein